MHNSYRTPYDDKPYRPPKSNTKRYATAAIVLSGALVGGSMLTAYNASSTRNYGLPFSYGGQQYYLPNDSRRAIYPSREACMQDVPPQRQSECEPASSYHGGSGYIGRWYGPVYTPRDAYRPNSLYPTEPVSSSNVGKKLPSGANKTGFGENGKAFTGSKGG